MDEIRRSYELRRALVCSGSRGFESRGSEYFSGSRPLWPVCSDATK